MCSDHICLLHQFLPFPSHSILSSFNFFKKFIEQFMLPIYSWVYALPLECGWCTRGHTPKGNSSSLRTYQLPTPSWIGVGLCVHFPPSMLGFDLTFTFPGLMHVLITTVSSYARMPCHVLKTLFPCSCVVSLVLTLFLSPLPQCLLISLL